MQKRDSICVRNSVFSCFVIKEVFQKSENAIRRANGIRIACYLQPICLKRLLCFEISADVYAMCVFSGHDVNFQPKHTA